MPELGCMHLHACPFLAMVALAAVLQASPPINNTSSFLASNWRLGAVWPPTTFRKRAPSICQGACVEGCEH